MSDESAIYLRKSRADIELEAHGELETLARHEKTLLDLAKKNALHVTAIYKEIVSGENIASRPEVQKLLTEVENGRFGSVLVMEVERLARGDTIDQGVIAQTFKYAGTKIITPVKTYDPNNEFDEEYFEFGLFMARREYKTINRRIQRGRIASVQEGKFIGSQPPYGYDKVKIKDGKGYMLCPNQNADIVRMIYDMYINEGIGAARIADKLDQMHIKPLNSSSWSKSTISDMLSNPVYAGKIRWSYKKETKFMLEGVSKKTRTRSDNFTLVDGVHEHIVSEEIFEKAQQIRKNRQRAPVKSSDTLKNPLAGFLYCGICGAPMTRLAPNTKTKYSTLKCPARGCANVSAPLFLIESKLLSCLNAWLFKYELNLAVQEQKNSSYPKAIKEHALSQLKTQIDKTSLQLENTYDLLEQGIYTKETFLARNSALSAKLEELKVQYDNLEHEIENNNKEEDTSTNMIPVIRNILDGYDALPDATEKNRLLKSVLSRIEYIKTERNTRGNLENDNFELTIFPIIKGLP